MQFALAYQNLASQMGTKDTLADGMLGKIVCKNYQIIEKINQGSFGIVYKAIHLVKKEHFAVKIELNVFIDINTQEKRKLGETLRLEMEILQKINGEKGFPRMFFYTEDNKQRILVETLLGKNLDELFHICNRKFSLKTVLLFIDQALMRLEFLHTLGVIAQNIKSYQYIHRDIKPDNFVIGTESNSETIYLLDFGLNLKIFENGKHIPRSKGQALVGTARFTPICSHQGYTQSRASDLESLGYLSMYFLKGTLPWIGIEGETKEERFYQIGQKKMRQTPDSLSTGLPREFSQFFNYIFTLRFDETPNYQFIRKLFRTLFINQKYSDQNYDWHGYEKYDPSLRSENVKQQIITQQDAPAIQEVQSSEELSKIRSSLNYVSKESNVQQRDKFQKSFTVAESNNRVSVTKISNSKQFEKRQSSKQVSILSSASYSENAGFTTTDEYYPYQPLYRQVEQLPNLQLKFY